MNTTDLISKVKGKLMQRIPPREVSPPEAPVFENTLLGDDIDLDKFPIPMHWPLDGGRYPGTADCVITRDPDSGYLNVGTYRMMQQGKREAGLYLSPGKDARLHIERAWGTWRINRSRCCLGCGSDLHAGRLPGLSEEYFRI